MSDHEIARETTWRFLRYSAEGVPEGEVALLYVAGLEDALMAVARSHATDADADTLARIREAIEPHMQAHGWQCPCCAAVHNAIEGES